MLHILQSEKMLRVNNYILTYSVFVLFIVFAGCRQHKTLPDISFGISQIPTKNEYSTAIAQKNPVKQQIVNSLETEPAEPTAVLLPKLPELKTSNTTVTQKDTSKVTRVKKESGWRRLPPWQRSGYVMILLSLLYVGFSFVLPAAIIAVYAHFMAGVTLLNIDAYGRWQKLPGFFVFIYILPFLAGIVLDGISASLLLFFGIFIFLPLLIALSLLFVMVWPLVASKQYAQLDLRQKADSLMAARTVILNFAIILIGAPVIFLLVLLASPALQVFLFSTLMYTGVITLVNLILALATGLLLLFLGLSSWIGRK